MKKIFPLLFLSLCLGMSSMAQNYSSLRHKVAVFAPLYLDSAYQGFQYKHGKNLPRYILPGLEFYQGVQLALDSLNMEGVPLEVFVYDTKSKSKPFRRQLTELPEVELIIGAVSGEEVTPLADLASRREVPFISASFPNDAGVKNNPYFVVLNSTLPVHIRTIYNYLQKNHTLHNVVYFRRNAANDEWLNNLFTETAEHSTGTPVKMKTVKSDNFFLDGDISQHLDSNATNICIAGSMDETFSRELAKALAVEGGKYRVKLIGMPTWDGYRELNTNEYKDLEITYTAPLYNPRADNISIGILDMYKKKFYARPSDMVFWGYGATWKFTRLLLEYGGDLHSNLSVNKFDVFTDYDIQPVIDKETDTLDYFENKKVFLITKVNGVVVSGK